MIIQNEEKLNLKGWKESGYDTAITDLTKDKDDIFKSFSSTKRNEINRAEREDITYKIKDTQKGTISNFLFFYNRFAAIKNLRKLHASDLKKFKKNDIIISTATYHNEDIVYHVYIQNGEKIRLLHSCSLFRNVQDKQFRNIVSYANNGLHYFDIIMAKEEGFEEYDR
jgi:hypothetical protein